MLSFKESLEKLKNSEELKSYLEKNSDAYLTNAIYLENLEFNFFSPKTMIITSFSVGKNISSKELDKEERTFPKLEIDKIKIDTKDVLKILEEEQKKYYSSEQPTKTILIIQQDAEPIWNISELTSAIKVLHVLISASKGKVLDSSYKQIIDMQ